MDGSQIAVLSATTGHAVIPDLGDYDDVSLEWAETEFRAPSPEGSVVGHWVGHPGWVRIDEWPYTEVCVIQSGSVELEDASGSVRRFGAGEAFVIPQGFRGVWRTLERCEKVFVGIPAA